MAEAVYMFLIKDPSALSVTAGGNVVDVQTIGTLLYQQYLLPFEITSFILLVAVVGAIVLTKPEKKKITVEQGEVKP